MTDTQAVGSFFEHPALALADQARRHGAAEAVCFPCTGRSLTFAQYDQQARRLAGALIAAGHMAGDRVALLAENRCEWPVVQMAAAYADVVFVPLNTHYRVHDLAHVLEASRAKTLLLSEQFGSNAYLGAVRGMRHRLRHLQRVICLDGARDGALGIEDFLAHAQALRDPLRVDVTAPAALLYTSGTTGFPKGAVLTHRGMMMCAHQTSERLGVAAGDRWASIIPLFHCAGCILNILGCLQAGAVYVGVPSFDPERMFQVIASGRCTVLSGVPTSYLAMLQHPSRGNYDLSSLRVGTCGGADVTPAILEQCASKFPIPGLCQVYGQTEGSTLIAASSPADLGRFATAGPPLPGYELRVVDPESGTELRQGSIGEIQGRGPMVMLGYDNDPVSTSETITSDGWLRTGDLGYLDPRGSLVVAGGRLRDMIIRGGENIYPVEVELLLQQHPAVVEIAVFGEPDTYYGETVAAAVRLARPCTAIELQEFANERIARFKVPHRIYVVDAYPKTPSGKIRKVELRQWAADGRMTALA